MGRKLYVGNLPYEHGENELRQLFEPFGAIDSVHVVIDKMTGRARGFAFVEMSTDAEAQSAISSLNGQQVGGRSLSVNEARPKPEFAGAGGGAGAGRPRGNRREPRW